MSELTREKIYKKELIAGGATGNNNLERIRSLAGGCTSSKLQSARAKAAVRNLGEFETKVWNNQPVEFYGRAVWTDGDNIYFTSGRGSYILNKETSTWEEIDLGAGNITTDDMWTDGENTYAYVYGGAGYIFDKKKKKWLPKEFNVSFNGGGAVWTDGENIYAYNGANEYLWNKENQSWEVIPSNVPQNFASILVWSDGTNTYCSNNGNNYVLDKATHTWSAKEWNGLTNINGSFVWFDGKNVHYSDGSSIPQNIKHYVLDIETSTWEEISYSSEVGYFTGNNVWTDGENVYISYKKNQQVMHISDGIIPH